MGSYKIGSECCNNCEHWQPERERRLEGCPPTQVVTYTNQAYCPLAKHSTLHDYCCPMFAHIGGVSKTFALPPQGPSISELYCEALLSDVCRAAETRAMRDREAEELRRREVADKNREILISNGMDDSASSSEQSEFESLYRRMAKADADAYYEMGEALYYGRSGAKVDKERALRCYLTAVDKGCQRAEYSVGYCYYYGEGVPKKETKGKEWLRRAAEHGSSSAKALLEKIIAREECAQIEAGRASDIERHVETQGMDPNASELEKSLFMMQVDLATNDAESQRELGDWFSAGIHGAKKDFVRAYDWYLKAAKSGDSSAQFRVGIAYYRGKGVEKDYEKAADWFAKSAEAGRTDAQLFLGTCYRRGFGVEKNLDKAFELYSKAAEDQREAKFWVGKFHEKGWGSVGKNAAEAFEWYLKSAESGYADAICAVGWAYQQGDGVKQDFGKAAEWFGEGVEKGDGFCANNLARLYEDGKGVEKNLEKSLELFEMAVDKKCNRANYHLGRFYENGIGVDVDIEKAKEYYGKAAEDNDKDAKAALERLG